MAGIYIHIPFCRKACNYCNFHFSTTRHLENDFTEALLREVCLQKDYLGGASISTVYFGGGTPSLLDPASLEQILNTLTRHHPIAADAEITLEANPDDISNSRAAAWKKMGINRLSIGVQSFVEEELQWMNRAHTATQALESITIAQQYFDQLTIDLIYGSPVLSDALWHANLDRALGLGIPHLSCYALTVEDKTALHHQITMKRKEAVSAEDQARQFEILMNRMDQAGYEHYEISNFALPGHRSKHNAAYWSGVPYLGLGPSAHSFNGTSRQWNMANNALYIQSLQSGQLCFEQEILTPVQQINEYLMTSLRTREGVNLEKITERFGSPAAAALEQQLKPWLQHGKALREGVHVRLTPQGKLYADGIAASLFFDRL